MKTALLFLTLLVLTLSGVYQQRYNEALSIAKAMTLDQKIGQAMQVDFEAFKHDGYTDEKMAANLFLGSVLIGGNGMPNADGNLIDVPGDEDLAVPV